MNKKEGKFLFQILIFIRTFLGIKMCFIIIFFYPKISFLGHFLSLKEMYRCCIMVYVRGGEKKP